MFNLLAKSLFKYWQNTYDHTGLVLDKLRLSVYSMHTHKYPLDHLFMSRQTYFRPRMPKCVIKNKIIKENDQFFSASEHGFITLEDSHSALTVTLAGLSVMIMYM